MHEDIFDRSIDVQILRLRRKLESYAKRAADHPDRARGRLHVLPCRSSSSELAAINVIPVLHA